jgi:hypothetical protein
MNSHNGCGLPSAEVASTFLPGSVSYYSLLCEMNRDTKCGVGITVTPSRLDILNHLHTFRLGIFSLRCTIRYGETMPHLPQAV